MIAIIVIVVVVAAATVFFFASSGKSSGTGSDIACTSAKPSASTFEILINSGASNSANGPGYSPDKIAVVIGKNSTITWVNNDSAHHTVTTSSAPSGGSFNSGDMGQGATYTCTFTEPGTYQYYCKYHGWMTGTIVAESGS